MRISDWSSDVCSSDLPLLRNEAAAPDPGAEARRNALAGRRQCLAIGQEKAVEQRQRDANRNAVDDAAQHLATGHVFHENSPSATRHSKLEPVLFEIGYRTAFGDKR